MRLVPWASWSEWAAVGGALLALLAGCSLLTAKPPAALTHYALDDTGAGRAQGASAPLPRRAVRALRRIAAAQACLRHLHVLQLRLRSSSLRRGRRVASHGVRGCMHAIRRASCNALCV